MIPITIIHLWGESKPITTDSTTTHMHTIDIIWSILIQIEIKISNCPLIWGGPIIICLFSKNCSKCPSCWKVWLNPKTSCHSFPVKWWIIFYSQFTWSIKKSCFPNSSKGLHYSVISCIISSRRAVLSEVTCIFKAILHDWTISRSSPGLK